MLFLLQAWESILAAFNSSQTGGEKSLAEIQKKYQNMKTLAKKEIAGNSLEMKKTGGGKATITISDDTSIFDFNAKQIEGFQNQFDSDYVNLSSAADNVTLVSDSEPYDDSNFGFVDEAAAVIPITSKFSSKKERLSVKKSDLVSLKEEGMKLDIEGKTLFIESMKLEVANKKLDHELKQLDIEMKKEQLKNMKAVEIKNL